MTRSLAIISAVIICAAALAGCGSSGNENTVHSADDLEGKIIGTQRGTTGYILAGDIKNAAVEAYNSGEEAVQALKDGTLDAVIIDSEPAKLFVSGNGDLQILSDPFTEEEYSIAYAKDNDELGSKLDAALTALKENGTLDDIISHWIGSSADRVPYADRNDNISNGTLIMATNAEFPPYESIEQGVIAGIDVDIMTAVCDELDMELQIENMEFDSIFSAVDSGKADVGAAGISITPEREKTVSFTQSYTSTTQVIITRRD